MSRNKERGDRKPHAIYCTAEHAEVCRQLVKLSDDQIAYVKGWMDRGANIGGKK